MKANTQTEAAILAVLEQYKQAYEQRHLERLLALFAPDPDVVVIGTGADEQRVGLAAFKTGVERDFAQSEGATIEWGWTSISAAGSVAWVAQNVIGHVTVAGQEVHLPFRFTAVLEQRGPTWLFLQVHLSSPAAEQAEGASFPPAE
jgi:ketosteroid isomerase-like protein